MNAKRCAAAVVVLMSSLPAAADVVVPLSTPHASTEVPAPKTTAVVAGGVGIERFGLPTVELTLATSSAPLKSSSGSLLIGTRFDIASRTIAVGAGAQFVQAIGAGWFVREAFLVSPFLGALDDVVGGLRGEGTVQVGVNLGAVDLFVGPRLTPVVAVVGGTDGRVGVDVAGGARWFVLDTVALTATLAGGADFGHRDAVFSSQTVAGAAFVGVQWAPR
ncbi:MAG TPA: hypothetical protein VGF99_22265 [Myxococcota bacterium]